MVWPSQASLLDFLLGTKAPLYCKPVAWFSCCVYSGAALKCYCFKRAKGILNGFPFYISAHPCFSKNWHISEFLPAVTVSESSGKWAIVFHHLESFLNSPKLGQFVCSKFIQPPIFINGYLSHVTNQSLTLRTPFMEYDTHMYHTHNIHIVTVTHNSSEVENMISLYVHN